MAGSHQETQGRGRGTGPFGLASAARATGRQPREVSRIYAVCAVLLRGGELHSLVALQWTSMRTNGPSRSVTNNHK